MKGKDSFSAYFVTKDTFVHKMCSSIIEVPSAKGMRREIQRKGSKLYYWVENSSECVCVHDFFLMVLLLLVEYYSVYV